jgi:hypothetical protein
VKIRWKYHGKKWSRWHQGDVEYIHGLLRGVGRFDRLSTSAGASDASQA